MLSLLVGISRFIVTVEGIHCENFNLFICSVIEILYFVIAIERLTTEIQAQVSCESLGSTNYWREFKPAKTCKMDRTTLINSAGYHMTTRDATVENFYFSHNKKIHYLPEDFSEMFPHLIVIMAQECSIKTISKQNFRNLTMLRGLSLRGNQIELIERGTFDEVVSLEYLSLRTLI